MFTLHLFIFTCVEIAPENNSLGDFGPFRNNIQRIRRNFY